MDGDVPGKRNICISIVSHAQMDLVTGLLGSLEKTGATSNICVILTMNVAEKDCAPFNKFSFPIKIVRNIKPRGFGANHNAAFTYCNSPFFCVLNPDILFMQNPFPELCCLLADSQIGVVAPSLVDSCGMVQDSARLFPTPLRILKRFFVAERPLEGNSALLFPDWIAGMFMLFRTPVYRELGGFDERFFMYCEDADICLRMQRRGKRCVVSTQVSVIHDARRNSHRVIRHFYWHVTSLLRFFRFHPFYRL